MLRIHTKHGVSTGDSRVINGVSMGSIRTKLYF